MRNGVINTSNREHRRQVFREPINILKYANLPIPRPRKNTGGKKNRKSNKRNTTTKKNTKRITKRKILIKNKSKRNKKN
jgi:hypothetical protein